MIRFSYLLFLKFILKYLDPLLSKVMKRFGDGSVYKKVRNIQVLQRNVNECNDCCRKGTNPQDRTRFNDPENPTPPDPTTSDVSLLFSSMACTCKELSENLTRMSIALQNDEILEKNLENSRKLIQNNMDAVRYAAPMMKNLSMLKIVVNNPSGITELASTN